VINKSDLSKIGIGSWGIGGFAERNLNNDDEKQIAALTYMFSNKMNFIEQNFWSSQGHGIELIKQALDRSGMTRDSIFISQAIYTYTAHSLDDAKKEVEAFKRLFNTDYTDTISINSAGFNEFGEQNVFDFYSQLLANGSTRYINLNNPSLTFLQKMHRQFGDKLFSIEICLNFEIRANEDLGIIKYAQDNGIVCVIFQPLRRNRTAARNWPLLVDLAKKYNKTQNQIILNWISSKGLLPITKSETITHITEHLDSLAFTINNTDLKKIDVFRPPNYDQPEIDWLGTGTGVRIDQLSNVFDDLCK